MKITKFLAIGLIFVLVASLFISCAKSETEPIAGIKPAADTESAAAT